MLTQTTVATGTDGYYFAEQARFLAEHGRFRSFENSVAVIFFGLIQRLLGDPVLAVKGGVSFLAGAAAPAGFLYGLYATGRFNRGFLLGFFLAVSPSLTYLCAHFPKTAGAIAFLFMALALLEKGLTQANHKATILTLSLFFFLALAFAHKLIFLLGTWVALGTLLDRASVPVRAQRGTLVFAFLLSVALLAAGKVLLPTDILRLFPALTWPQGWPLRLLGERIFLHPVLRAEIILGVFAILPGFLLFRARLDFQYRMGAWILLIPALFNPFLNYQVLDVGYRLVLTVFLPGAVLWAFWCADRRAGFYGGLALCGLMFFFTKKVYDPRFDEKNFFTYRQVIDRMPHTDFPLVICHLGLNYYYTWATGQDALAFLPDDNVYPPDRTWRISWGVSRDAYEDILGESNKTGFSPIQMLTPDYALVREDVWRLFSNRIPRGSFLQEVATSWRNPHAPRPPFISARTLKPHISQKRRESP